MPKLPVSGPGGGPNIVPLPTQETQAAGYPLRQAGIAAERMANQPNVLGVTAEAGTNIANQLQGYEEKNRAKEDAVAMSLARTAYFQDASDKFSTAEQQGITSGPQFQDLTKQLTDSRDKALNNFTGSDDAKARLAAQLNEAHVNFGMKALAIRQRQTAQQFDNEFNAGVNRMASNVIDHPSLLDQNLNDGQVMLDSFEGGMTPQEKEQYRQKMRSQLTGTAAEQFIASGQPDAAQAVLDKYGSDMTPTQQATYERHIQALKAPPAPITPYQQEELKLRQREQQIALMRLGQEGDIAREHIKQGWAGVGLRGAELNLQANKPGPESAAQAAFGKGSAEQFLGKLNDYDAKATQAQSDFETASQIGTMLKDVPGGTTPSNTLNWLEKNLGINPEKAANIEVARSLTMGKVMEKARALAPVTEPDVQMLLKTVAPSDLMTPLGREKMTYAFKRIAEYAGHMNEESQYVRDQVRTGVWDEGTARRHLMQYETLLRQKSHETFHPPTSVAEQK